MNIIQELADNVVSRNWSGIPVVCGPWREVDHEGVAFACWEQPAVTAGADPAGS